VTEICGNRSQTHVSSVQLTCPGKTCASHTSVFYIRLLKLVGSMELVHCAILLAVIFQANGNIEVSEKSVEVRTGDDAMLGCSTPSSKIEFCQFKSPSGESFILREGLLYDNDRITYNGEDTASDCGIKITKIGEKDNGLWTCSITTIVDGKAQIIEESVEVVVSKPPNKVKIEVDGAESSNMIVNYRESRNKKVSCVADGARPAATFSWTLGEDPFNGNVEDMEAVKYDDGSMKQVQVLNYEAEPSHNGKALSCIVHHNGFTQDDIRANRNMDTLYLDVQFQPVAADHPQSFYNLQVGSKKEIHMSFRAHPKPTQVFWTMYDDSTVGEGAESLNKRFMADVLQEGPNEGMFTAKLIINEVMEEDAGSENKLTVTNELGTTVYPFTLSLGDKPASAAGTGPVIAIVIVAIIIIIVIVVAVIARSQGMLCFADPPKAEDDKEKAVEKEEGSETESAKGEETTKDEVDEATVEDGEMINNNKETKTKSVTAKMTSLLSAMKKSVGSRKEKYSEGSESEVKTPLQEGKENGIETDERKDDSIVYADLDKSAMSSASATKVAVENEKTAYAEIKPETKEK